MKTRDNLLSRENFGPWAVVTGASSGIGKEFARQLAASGFNIVLVARREQILNELGASLAGEHGIDYRVVCVDLSDGDCVRLIETATRELDVGLLVSNAGTGNPGEFLNADLKALLQIVRLNVDAHLRLTHHFGQRLAKRRRGGIVLVGAMGATQGIPFMANDAATKSYVQSLGEGLHVEFKKLGVNLTVLVPGATDTPVLEKFGITAADMPMKPTSVGQCVRETLAALAANRATHIPGLVNRLVSALLPSFVMRRLFANLMARGLAGKPSEHHA